MRKDNIRKYILPNIPYLFVLWACLKAGTAYRLAAGADLAHKLVGMTAALGPAFADFAPGLNPFDWLVGIAGAAGIRLLIYCKAKKAKKFRPDAEYGSARWGGPKDIAPFADPKFENNVILTKTEFLTTNTRPKNPANARNLNACVIGSSGSGKTRFWLTPQLLQAHSSYVVVDPKGGVLSQVGYFLQRKKGYRIKVFNSIDFSKSMHYNPLAYIRNEADILKFVNALISNTKGEGKEGDPFWTKSETLLYCALIAYIIFEGPAEDRNMNTLVDMISGMEVKEDELTRGFISQMLRNPIYAQADLEMYEFFKGPGTVVINEAADFAGTNGCYLYQGRDVQARKNKHLKDQILVMAPSEGLVSADVWLRCRKKLMANTTFQNGRKAKNTWLAGKVKCGRCGYALMSVGNPSGVQYLR